jgi:hypothetical protein
VPRLIRPALLVAVVLALIAAGCGGSSSDTKANKAYADSVCSAVGTWRQQVQEILTDFSGGISKASLQKKVDQAQAATQTMVTQVNSVSPPDTDQGKAAKQQVDQLTDDVKTFVNTAKGKVAALPENATLQTITGSVASLGPQVQSLVTETKSAISSIKDAGGELADAFKSTDSCKKLSTT